MPHEEDLLDPHNLKALFDEIHKELDRGKLNNSSGKLNNDAIIARKKKEEVNVINVVGRTGFANEENVKG